MESRGGKESRQAGGCGGAVVPRESEEFQRSSDARNKIGVAATITSGVVAAVVFVSSNSGGGHFSPLLVSLNDMGLLLLLWFCYKKYGEIITLFFFFRRNPKQKLRTICQTGLQFSKKKTAFLVLISLGIFILVLMFYNVLDIRYI